MKINKILLGFVSAICLLVAGCTHLDDFKSTNLPQGPQIKVDITNVKDSTFTITLTPGEKTLYYSYVVIENNDQETIDSLSLIKGNIEGLASGVFEVAKKPTATITLDDELLQNTTYQIYAVAADANGMCGNVARVTQKTPDSYKPEAVDLEESEDGMSATIIFDETVYRSTGKVTYTLYTLPGGEVNEGEFAADDIAIDGENVTVTLHGDIPTGTYVCISWEASAFKDASGNEVEEMTSFLDEEEGEFIGISYRVPIKAFEIKDEYFKATPEIFTDWTTFSIIADFPIEIYKSRNTEEGTIMVTYVSPGKDVQLNTANWTVADKKLTIKLPEGEAPDPGAYIRLTISEGALTDQYGNPNKAYDTEEGLWMHSYNKDINSIFNSYIFNYYAEYGEENVSENISMEAGEGENGVLIKGIYDENSEVPGKFDGQWGTLIIEGGYEVGEYVLGNGTTAAIVLFGDSDDNSITLQIDKNGNFSSLMDIWYYAFDAESGKELGVLENAMNGKLTIASAQVNKTVKRSGKIIPSSKNLTGKLKK